METGSGIFYNGVHLMYWISWDSTASFEGLDAVVVASSALASGVDEVSACLEHAERRMPKPRDKRIGKVRSSIGSKDYVPFVGCKLIPCMSTMKERILWL